MGEPALGLARVEAPDVILPREAAVLLSLTVAHVYALLEAGRLPVATWAFAVGAARLGLGLQAEHFWSHEPLRAAAAAGRVQEE